MSDFRQDSIDNIEHWRNKALLLSRSDKLGHLLMSSLELMQSVVATGPSSKSLPIKIQALSMECASALAEDPRSDDDERSLHYGTVQSVCALLTSMTGRSEEKMEASMRACTNNQANSAGDFRPFDNDFNLPTPAPMVSAESVGDASSFNSQASVSILIASSSSARDDSKEEDTSREALERFTEDFKRRREVLGISQKNVAKALAHLSLPDIGALSQSAISRFESHSNDISHNTMIALKPILQSWLETTEKQGKHRNSENGSFSSRRRTVLSETQKRALEDYFRQQPVQSGERYTAIAKELDLERKSVIFWFQNKRLRKKRAVL